ncbi:hypothetical protein PEX1_026190 [Penicillium expansum]|uniref:Ssl1-like domain-containing protein n=1 Tax=Penicillium expansum TaxID=27334 RepID=A0A0A2I0G9_PENEN|nr:hypothetical protein PEX2_033900 [Penicillium expansum]KGO36644.1 hypothetical protein PEXP_004790 [Penicillium expansum]KGO60401.1 hypothetical protein PEX2_033900 [Penicillium expansum]KGO69100.1 hypothetical protein PEX1_026190 [Penicillium expansum]
MADSDEEYVGEVTEDEDDLQVTRGDNPRAKRKQRGGAEWELSRTWETLVEGADGTINSTVEGLLEAGKRKRLLKDTTPLQRGIIRHLILILDLSQSMSEKDLRPTRYLLTLRYAQEFVREFFEQNPISQLGVLGLRDGLALRVSDMSGNPTEHLTAIQALKTQDPKGLPSLQNGLEMARGALFRLLRERICKLIADDGVPFSYSGVQSLALRMPFKALTRRLSLLTMQQQSV